MSRSWKKMRGGRPARIGLAVSLAVSLGEVGSGAAASAASNARSILVGISYPSAGPDAIYSNKFKAARLYLEYLNKNGGVNGYKFKFVAENNSCTAVGGATAVRQLVSQRPFMIFSSCSDSFSGAISTLKSAAPSTPVILDGNASLIQPSGLKYVYGTSPNYVGDCEYLMRYAVTSLHMKKLGILYDEGPNGAPAADPCAAYAKSIGAKSVSFLGIPAATSDFAGLGARIASSGAQAWIAFCLIRHEVATVNAASSAGYKGTWLTQSSNFSYQLVQEAKSSLDGTYISSYIQPPRTTNTAAAKLFEKVVKPAIPTAWGVLGAQGWSAGYVVAYGVRKATEGGKALTQAGFAAALSGIKGMTMGLMPDLTYADGKPGSHYPSAVRAEGVYRIESGAYVPVALPRFMPSVTG